MEGMLNMSQHLSFSNLPRSRGSDWLEGSAGMGKRNNGLSNRVHGKMWSNLNSYKIGVDLNEVTEKTEGRESEK